MEAEEISNQRRKMETLGRLTAFAVHDLNNLLMLIDGYARLLEGEDLTAEARQTVNEILMAGDRASELTKQLLGVVRNQPVPERILDLRSSIEGAAPLLERVLGEAVKFSWEASEGLLLRSRPGRLEQVLLNLAVNAREAMPGGGEFTVRAGREGDRIWLEAEDTGPGVGADWTDKIFQPFFSTKGANAGAGVGLAIVAEICAEWGGSIRVEKRRGACFRVEAPLAGQVAARILLLEDEPALRGLIARTLRGVGHEVEEAGTVQEAQEKLGRGPEFAILVTDVQLREGDGEALAREWMQERRTLKTLKISGFPGLRTGPRELFLQKPFSANTLVLAVQKLLQEL